MMNEEMEQFEQRLSRQPLKPVPAAWRAEILATACGARATRHSSFVIRRPWLSTLNQKLSAIFWPHPVAWAGLAAIWIFIFAVNVSLRDNAPLMAKKESAPTPEAVAELRQQRKLFAELMGANETHDADRRKLLSPKPRSEYVAISMA